MSWANIYQANHFRPCSCLIDVALDGVFEVVPDVDLDIVLDACLDGPVVALW